MSKKIEDLRTALFDQLERLQGADDGQLGKEIQRANAVVNIATAIIDSSRAETEFLKMANEFQQTPSLGSGFINETGAKKLNQ